MKWGLTQYFVYLFLSDLASSTEETHKEWEKSVVQRNHCVSTYWDLLMLKNHSRSLSVPCIKKHRRLEFPTSITKQIDEESEDAVIGGFGILGSTENLTQWAMKEEIIFHLASKRLRNVRQEIMIITEYIKDFESSTGRLLKGLKRLVRNARERANVVASSVTAAYRMTHRYVKELQKIKELVAKDKVEKDFIDVLWGQDEQISIVLGRRTPQKVSYTWLSRVDLNSAMQSLIHIQEINGLDFDSLRAALGFESQHPAPLNAFHCKEIGLYALLQKQFDSAVGWIEEAVKKVMKNADSSVTLASLEAELEIVAHQHNEAHHGTLIEKDPMKGTRNIFTSRVLPFLLEKRETLSQALMRKFGYGKGWNTSFINFNYLCSGHEFQTDLEKSRLKCWADSDSHPYWKLRPLKKERLAWNPPVVQIYEFLTEREISEIKEAAEKEKDGFRMSGVEGMTSVANRSTVRTSVNSWVEHGDLPLLEKKIEFLSGLQVKGPLASDRLQVVEYVYGRLYLPHPDVVPPMGNQDSELIKKMIESMADTGDRVVTVLFYLNDVMGGGATPFCDGGVSAKPVRGSAIIWENLYKNGSSRHDTWHGSCPVLYGNKIVANKWIRYNKQFQKFKCSLNRWE